MPALFLRITQVASAVLRRKRPPRLIRSQRMIRRTSSGMSLTPSGKLSDFTKGSGGGGSNGALRSVEVFVGLFGLPVVLAAAGVGPGLAGGATLRVRLRLAVLAFLAVAGPLLTDLVVRLRRGQGGSGISSTAMSSGGLPSKLRGSPVVRLIVGPKTRPRWSASIFRDGPLVVPSAVAPRRRSSPRGRTALRIVPLRPG